MYLFKKVTDLAAYLKQLRQQQQSIAFVPTMGALHEGHTSLVALAENHADVTIASIFVNPTQFNDPTDLEMYPRNEGLDIFKLANQQCDIVFLPDAHEIYPEGACEQPALDFGPLAEVMEGAFRPQHFKGVAQVMQRLLEIIEPDFLVMGRKDFQQCVIVSTLLEKLKLPAKLIIGPTIREADGLAMSSRNVRLTPAGRAKAPAIFKTLKAAAGKISYLTPEALKKWAIEKLQSHHLKAEYFELVDAKTLEPVTRFETAGQIVACTAVWIDDVRLIDNLTIK